MKKGKWFDKALIGLNSLVAALLLLSYLLPMIPAASFPSLAVLSLAFPLLVLINLGFLVFWLIQLKRPFLISALVLLLGFGKVKSLYIFGSSDAVASQDEYVSVMSYNVRLFNLYDWISDTEVRPKIAEMVQQDDPDILCFQEFLVAATPDYAQFPYHYIKPRSKNNKMGLAIFSKYPFLKKGSLDFPNSNNNAIYVDVLRESDTLRIYNLHLESLKIDTAKEEITQESSGRLWKRASSAFVKQETQAALFVTHEEASSYPVIVCGDLNNTAFSHAYKLVRGEKKDAFLEAGSGFGKTFNYKSLPIRIDFVFTSEAIEVLDFQNAYPNLSDHFPITTTLKLP